VIYKKEALSLVRFKTIPPVADAPFSACVKDITHSIALLTMSQPLYRPHIACTGNTARSGNQPPFHSESHRPPFLRHHPLAIITVKPTTPINTDKLDDTCFANALSFILLHLLPSPLTRDMFTLLFEPSHPMTSSDPGNVKLDTTQCASVGQYYAFEN